MLATIAGILIVVWLVGLLAFKSVGAIIHILLIIGIIMLVLHFVRGRRTL
ncbi:MAG: lmo0937 family membrane protein [Sphingomicrobium sp.]